MIRVQAIRCGFYGNKRRKPEEIFYVKDQKEVGKWMLLLDQDEPSKTVEKKSVSRPVRKTGSNQDVI